MTDRPTKQELLSEDKIDCDYWMNCTIDEFEDCEARIADRLARREFEEQWAEYMEYVRAVF